MVCSHLCLSLLPHSDKNLLGRVRVHWCPLHSSVLLDKYPRIRLRLEWQTENPLDSRTLVVETFQ